MKNLKILAIASVISVIAINNANAKTEGNYLGLDLIRTELDFNTNNYGGNNLYEIKKDDQVSIGVNYKYAFNFDNFFVTPGVLYDYTNLSLKDKDGDKWNLNHRYGIGIDIGYDLHDKFAVFANISGIRSMYKVDWKSIVASNRDYDDSMSYALGAKYSVLDNLDVKVSYEISSVNMKEPTTVGRSTEFNINIMRLGVSYKW
ncbi:outer membrane protein [Pseudomonadota bacterium]